MNAKHFLVTLIILSAFLVLLLHLFNHFTINDIRDLYHGITLVLYHFVNYGHFMAISGNYFDKAKLQSVGVFRRTRCTSADFVSRRSDVSRPSSPTD